MPPKVDPTEIRYSTALPIQSTSRSSEENPDPQPLWPPNSVPSVWYTHNNSERQESRLRYYQRRRKVERNQSYGSAQVPKQSR